MPIERDKTRKIYTKEDIILSLRRYAKKNGLTYVSQKAYRNEGEVPSVATIKRFFGSWKEAIKQSGLDESPKKKEISKKEVLQLLKGYILQNGGTLPINVYEKNKKKEHPSRKYIARMFGTWNEAVRLAGGESFVFYTDEEMLSSLREAAKENGGKISYNRYQEMDFLPGASVIVQRFGTWNEALKKAKIKINQERELWYTREDCLEQIRECAEENDGIVTSILYELSDRKPSYDTIIRYFESWEEALKEAGIQHIHRFYSKEHLIATLRAVHRKNGHITLDIYESTEDVPHISTIYQTFGSWGKALKAAGLEDARYILTDEEIIDNVIQLSVAYSQFLTPTVYEEYGLEPDLSTVYHRFGSFYHLLERADLLKEQNIRLAKEVIPFIDDEKEEPFTFQAYQLAGGKIGYEAMTQYGGSWSNIAEQALHYKKTKEFKKDVSNREQYIYSDDMLLKSVETFMKENNGSTSSLLYMQQQRKPALQTICNRFGGWKKAIEKVKLLKR